MIEIIKRSNKRNIVSSDQAECHTVLPSKKPKFCQNSNYENFFDFKVLNFKYFKSEECIECREICTYEISELNLKKFLNQNLIKEELSKHGHKKSRLVDKRQRNAEEAKRELIAHYKTWHSM